MEDALGGLAQGLAQGLGQVNKTVDTLEAMKQRREQLRLQNNQDRRAQESHDANMLKMAEQLKTLQMDNFKRRLIDETEAIANGWRDGFSPELMADPFYQQMFRNFNIRPTSYYGKDVLDKQGIGDDAGDWYIGSNDQGEFVKIKKDMFHQMTGYQTRLNKRSLESAQTLNTQAKAMRENMITQNQEALQGLFLELSDEFGAMIEDPTVPADKKAQYAGWLDQLAQFKPPTMSLKDTESYAQKEAKDIQLWTEQIRRGDFTNYERATKLVNTAAQNALIQTAAAEGLMVHGVDASKPFDREKWETTEAGKKNAYYLNAYRNTIANTAGAANVRKQMNETLGKGADLFLVDLGKQLKGREPGKEPERSMVQSVKKSLLAYMPDEYLADLKGANTDNEAFNVVAQLFINSYGNEKFGSALTEGEIERIDKAFGTDWKNTTTFLQGAMAQLRNSLQRMEEAAASDPKYAYITYGKEYINRQLALKNLQNAYDQIIDYSKWKADNPRGTAKEYVAQRDARKQAQSATMQTNAPATQPTAQDTDRKARLRALANKSFGGE